MGRKGLVCWQCKQPVLVKDVGEERRRFPGTKDEVLCKTCQRANVAAAVAKNRKELGLDGSQSIRS